jgi:hypothetical protein
MVFYQFSFFFAFDFQQFTLSDIEADVLDELDDPLELIC